MREENLLGKPRLLCGSIDSEVHLAVGIIIISVHLNSHPPILTFFLGDQPAPSMNHVTGIDQLPLHVLGEPPNPVQLCWLKFIDR